MELMQTRGIRDSRSESEWPIGHRQGCLGVDKRSRGAAGMELTLAKTTEALAGLTIAVQQAFNHFGVVKSLIYAERACFTLLRTISASIGLH